MNPDAASSKDWYQVRLTVPWVVPGAPGVQDAINISVAEVGKRASASNVRSCDIEVQDLACPGCGYEMEAALCTTGYGMVVLDVTVEVTARSLEDSRTVAKRELGSRMKDIPLTVIEAAPLETGDTQAPGRADLGAPSTQHRESNRM
ncbi:DUF555 domain-containing protein [Halosimplex aquaticum]|uniref:DUF555 domain-containing protein n=1 Tax=Halosimplex aquaticum TaxID=3026162 RepID=A0ABD5Y9M1_9EURY